MAESTAPDRELTVEQYLALEREAPIRHDLVGGFRHPVPETSPRHDQIVENIYRTLVETAEWMAENPEYNDDSPCRVMTRTVNLLAFMNAVYYPDVMVVCGGAPNEYGIEHAPCMLVEVMTPDHETIDQSEKWGAYNRIPSLRMYLVVDSERRRVDRFIRSSEGNWLHAVDGDDAEFNIPCPLSRLSLHSIYEGV